MLVVHDSMHGSTEKIARAIGSATGPDTVIETVGIAAEGTIFYMPQGIPGILAVLASGMGRFLVALTK